MGRRMTLVAVLGVCRLREELQNIGGITCKTELENRKGELRFLELRIKQLESRPVQKEIEELRTRRNKLANDLLISNP